MPTRDINEYLESGEVDAINKGDILPDDAVLDKGETQTLVDDSIASALIPIDVRLTELEEGHTVVLSAVSTLADQQPVALDTALQVTYGPAQEVVGAPVHVSAAGALTFNTADKYVINFRAHYGRTGASGTSILMFRFLKNGIAQGNPFAAKLADADTLVPWDSSSFTFDAEVGDVLTAEILRDGAGSNFGGLFAVPSNTTWGTAPCAAVSLYKV